MMFRVSDLHDLSKIPTVKHSMFLDRARQFVDRHKWPLRLDRAGYEIDEFDDAWTIYCIVEERGRHVASVRLRPADAGSMVERHFPPLWQGTEARLRDGVEITRFCAAPDLSPDRRLIAVSELLLGLCRHCRRSGIDSFFGVVFPTVARVFRQSGWPAVVLGEARQGSDILQLAEWTPSEIVAWDIQERRAAREDLSRQRKAAGLRSEMRLVA